MKKKPNLVQTYTIHPNLVVCPIAKLFFAKTVIMITGMGALSISNKRIIKKTYDILYKLNSLFCDYLIFVNNHDKRYFEEKLGISKPFLNIWCRCSKEKII